jgi:hypothetical protein
MTAVEWFQEQIIKIVNGTCELSEIQIFEQAKAMEKEQTLDFTRNAVRKILDEDRQNPFNLEQYYNETYGGDK